MFVSTINIYNLFKTFQNILKLFSKGAKIFLLLLKCISTKKKKKINNKCLKHY